MAGDFDEGFVAARLAEVRALLADERLASQPGVHVWPGDVATGYRQWAGTYDEPRNSLFDIEEPVMHEILEALPAGRAIDAACGTGRYSAYLAGRGQAVVGVDHSEDMLAVARARLPHGDFWAGSLDRLPVTDSSADLIVCASLWPTYRNSVSSWQSSRVCSAPAGTWSCPTLTMDSSSGDRS